MEALAALRLWAYEVTFPRILGPHGAPYVFRIEPRPAADWIVATLERGHLGYLPGMLGREEYEMMIDALADGDVSHDELVEANRDALETISGWPWWSAGKLIGVLAHQFELFGGLLVLSGVDLQKQPLAAVLAAINAKVISEASKEDKAKWANELAMPPPEMLSADGWDEEAATRALELLMAAGGGGYGDG
jgi:hypothetical protein